ncbi:Hypothetical predicted protein [Lecanosticta acicola]|uniref:DUF6606 domain-containing protein n=1 Tax=Lecanosticta acicola TaxID=111012 RepID=A0AAI9E9K7_9PEZI|nr:Hypothetical predicted protein [Lecanosticta acicola]
MEELEGITRYLFLPPQLPQKEGSATTETAFLEVVMKALLAFRARGPSAAVDKAISLLSKLEDVYSELDVSRANSAYLLTTLNKSRSEEVMAVKVIALRPQQTQNIKADKMHHQMQQMSGRYFEAHSRRVHCLHLECDSSSIRVGAAPA